MKKILLIVSAIALIGSAVNAADVPVEVKASVSGSASFTFGANLDPISKGGSDYATGFKNANSASLSVSIVSSTSAGDKGEGEVYAEIKVSNISASLGGGASASGVTAKIYLGPVFVNILGIANNVDQASTGMGLAPAKIFFDGQNTEFKLEGEHQGLSIGLTDTSMVKFEVGVNSYKDWTYAGAGDTKVKIVSITDLKKDVDIDTLIPSGSDLVSVSTVSGGTLTAFSSYDSDHKITADATQTEDYGLIYYKASANADNENNVYQFYVSLGLGDKLVEGLSFDVAANFTNAANDNTSGATSGFGFGGAVGYKLALGEDFGLAVKAGADYNSKTDSSDVVTTNLQISGGLGFTLKGSAKSGDFFGVTGLSVPTGVSVGYTYLASAVDGDTEYPALLTATLFDGDLIPVLDLVAVAEYDTAYEKKDGTTSEANLGYGIRASAKIDMLEVYGEFWSKNKDNTDFVNDDGSADDVQSIKIGVDLSPLKLVTVSLGYTSGNLLMLSENASSRDKKKTGTFEATVKLAF